MKYVASCEIVNRISIE